MAADKASVLQQLDTEFQNLRQAIDGLKPDQLERVWFDAWSVKDILAHVLGWQREMIPALERIARGERPTPEGVDYSDSDAWNAKFALAFARQLPTTVLAEWQQTHMNYARAARAVPDDRFGEADGKLKTANRLIETSGSGHYREHAAQILEWRKREGL
jgi:hypothetical protein